MSRVPTFSTYFLHEAQRLTGLSTTSVKRLCRCASTQAPSAAECVFFYALGCGRVTYLLGCAKGTKLEEEYLQMACLVGEMSEDELVASGDVLPWRFRKALSTYSGMHDRLEMREAVKEAWRVELSAVFADGSVSLRETCRELGLNPGNVSAWLRHGGRSKVAYESARRLREYVTAGAAEPDVDLQVRARQNEAVADYVKKAKSRKSPAGCASTHMDSPTHSHSLVSYAQSPLHEMA